ncbi:hypothetical protein F3Y22_tig00111157pilonHSYRG00040 [Hibiscus syriacus]|uniref:RNase H type-1 domain-containing protein n=1 Tax=Hibiscus syriacus TaxID=106335 RepID=A0A6A2YXD3_HIBSY|nr:hypothetical protein F3Y22_tig00111157pilonHSYRG00040 [Hibiscus syriacus]
MLPLGPRSFMPDRGSLPNLPVDSLGTFIGYHREYGCCSVLNAELWGLLDGLRLAWDYGIRRILIEMDNVEAIKLITNPSPSNNSTILMPSLAMVSRWDQASRIGKHRIRSWKLSLPAGLERNL